MHARYNSNAVHSLGISSKISTARRQQILARTSQTKASPVGAVASKPNNAEQEMIEVVVDLSTVPTVD